jgi:hypothetical protein
MGAINNSDRIAATLYSLGAWFVSGIYIYIPCIREIVYLPIIIIIIIITCNLAIIVEIFGRSLLCFWYSSTLSCCFLRKKEEFFSSSWLALILLQGQFIL